MPQTLKVALLGSPNTGKTSVFNTLTKLNQKVGNYPGITVEKKEGTWTLSKDFKVKLFDFPGCYSLNANSIDESIVIETLLNKQDQDYPHVVIVVADVENLKRSLLFFTQIKGLNIPSILAINMADRMDKKGVEIDIKRLEKELDTKVVLVSARKNTGFEKLKQVLLDYKTLSVREIFDISKIDSNYFHDLKKTFPKESLYRLWLLITQEANFTKLKRKKITDTSDFRTLSTLSLKKLQQKETIQRYVFINDVLKKTFTVNPSKAKSIGSVLDRVLLHKVFGYVIFFAILLLIFESIYDFSSIPMDFIDATFTQLSQWVKHSFPSGNLTHLIADGVIPGIGGIVIFIPQIALLYFFLALLEESGYMSRVIFLMDKGLRKFGMSGKSVIPLVSGTACAIPAVMATRNIENWRERLITILVTPFATCAARLPVYAILIALVIPDQGFYQSLTLMGLYLIGFVAAMLSAWVLHQSFMIDKKSFFVIEMPSYKVPLLKDVFYTVWEKTKTFIVEAGKIILAISIVLWVLATNGPRDNFKQAEEFITQQDTTDQSIDLEDQIQSYKLENSYIGILGRSIEPMIAPLGFDWKIGIALLSSFAAREVFVGTLATIYSVDSEKQETIKERMANEKRADGKPLFSLATGISLMLFYAFALQCMSTVAIVRIETKTWKWPLIQLFSMTFLAYVVSLFAFQILQ